jgi:hypothetical protein
MELLETGRLQLPAQGENADWLRMVRRGGVSFGEWWKRVLDLYSDLEHALVDDSYPVEPNRKAIEDYSIITHLGHWNFND